MTTKVLRETIKDPHENTMDMFFFCDSLTLVLHVCQIEPVVTKPVRPGFGIDASFDQGVGVHWICHARLLLGLPASHRASQQTARHPFPKRQMNEVNSEWSYVA